jgi:hypothetical protein
MSDTVETTEAKTPADARPLTAAEQQVAQVNQVVSNAVAALMDIANLLRDIPKLVAVNVQLAERLGLSQSAQAEQEELKN